MVSPGAALTELARAAVKLDNYANGFAATSLAAGMAKQKLAERERGERAQFPQAECPRRHEIRSCHARLSMYTSPAAEEGRPDKKIAEPKWRPHAE